VRQLAIEQLTPPDEFARSLTGSVSVDYSAAAPSRWRQGHAAATG